MNGDVGKQYCGVCPPSTSETPTPMAVESPVEAPASSSSTSSSSSSDLSTSAAVVAPVESPPSSSKASLPEPKEEMAASAAQSGDQDGKVVESVPLASEQQNGEVSLDSDSQTSATAIPSIPSVPSPVPPPPPQSICSSDTISSDTPPEQSENTDEGSERKSEEVSSATSENQGTQTTPAQTPPTPTATPGATQPQPAASQPLSRDQIQQLVAQQVEYFFSRENLSNDPYLISQMDSDQYVPVFILANCSQFKSITNDHSIIVEALKESPYVQLDEENNRVRPNYKRCIVILREIPESTPVEEIEAVFKSDDCPKVVSCEFVHNSSWYVTFESDEDAQKAYWFLRGTVQTFKGKPILARIKTKPISRLGCLSVLPSYGGKAGEGKEGSGPPSTPGSAGLPSGGPPTPQQNANYNAPGQRFMYSPPTSVNANSYTPTYTMPANMPTAFFYPNMVQWTAPGSFYDINGFLQFNGLSPQAAFKPPTTNHNVRYNQNRRNNKRDGNRYDKGDNRHNNSGGQVGGGPGGNNNHGGHMGGHYHPNQRPYHHNRPQSSQSPSLPPHRPSHPPPASNGGPTPPPPPPPPPSSAHAANLPATTGGNNHPNHLSFAQSDLALASQSDLYTSFSPPVGSALHAIRNDKKEGPNTASKNNNSSNSSSSQNTNGSTIPSSSSSLSCVNPPASSSTSMLNNATVSTVPATTATPSSATTTSAVASTTTTSTTTVQIPSSPHQHGHGPPSLHPNNHHPHHPHHHHPQHQQTPPPPPPHQPSSGGPPHRNNYNNDHYHHYHHHYHNMARDAQQPRQMPRGIRRRPRGRDEESTSSGNNNRGMTQRGNSSQPPAADKSGNTSQESTPPPPPQPQFDLQATAFPPLPGADEPVPVAEEKRPAEPLVSPWGGDTQKFSDVMKGTAKPRPTSQSSEKDLPQESMPGAAPTNSSLSASPCPTVTAAPTVVAAAASQTSHVISSTSSSSSTSTAAIPNSVQSISTVVSTTAPLNSSTSTSTVISQSSSVSQSSTSGSKQSESRPPPPREQRGNRDDRRVGASGGHRDRRDYGRDHPREYQRDYQRDTNRPGMNSRDRDYNRVGREGSVRSGKENRPIPTTRQWKEDKADAEGWITKGSREPRFHREVNREQRGERTEIPRDTSRTPLVNGDSSPPPSPKAPKTDAKVNSEESNAEYKLSSSKSLNNNDGEHKTSWAKMALASKDHMERLAAELKEKEEQEKKMRFHGRPQTKPQEKVLIPRERDGKPIRREGLPRENRLSSERGPVPFRSRDSARPKSPK